VVPCSRCLLQAVEGPVEPAHQMRMHGVNEANGLRAVDDLGKCAMEEGIFDVELEHRPIPGDCQSQHSSDGGRLDDAEGLIVAHPRALSEASEDPTTLVSIKIAMCLELVLEDPLIGDDIGPRGRGTKSHMLLDSRASYSSIVQCQWGSTSALQAEVGTRDNVRGAAAVESCRRSMGLVTSAARRVTIGWVLRGS
jgi:hypothetical protein